MIRTLRTSWMGVAIAASLTVAAVALFALDHASTGMLIIAVLLGQALPQPVHQADDGEP
jgi:hypothetical protein